MGIIDTFLAVWRNRWTTMVRIYIFFKSLYDGWGELLRIWDIMDAIIEEAENFEQLVADNCNCEDEEPTA